MSEGVRTRRQRRESEEAAAKEKRRRSIGEVLSHGREVPKGVPLDTGLAMLTEEQEGKGLRVDSAVESAEAYAKERSPKSKIPLYDIWKNAMAKYSKKTSNRAKRILLKDLPEWEVSGRKAYTQVKELMSQALRNSFFNPEEKLCVFTDASKDFYCMVFTQCKPGHEKLPWSQQDGKHRLLLIVSGRFRNAQLNWHIVEKEAYPLGVRLMDFTHWVNCGLDHQCQAAYDR